jgi:DNA-nicking Smr family endonuclease
MVPPPQPPQPPDSPEPVEPQDVVPAIEIEDVIDLHGFQPRDIPSVVEEYIHAAHEKGLREVRLIHGRGTGFQRHRVREVLAGLACVERFTDAPPGRGGWGATLVWLDAKV